VKHQRSATWYAVIACAAFVICTYIGDFMRLAGLRRILHGWVWVGVANLFQLIICVSAIAAAHSVKFKRALSELGLRAPIGQVTQFVEH